MPLRELTNLGQIKQGLGYTPTPELDYAQIITPSASIAATTEATAGAVITGNSIYCDGSRVKVETSFVAGPSANITVTFVLLRDGVVIGQSKLATGATSPFVPIYFSVFDSPSPGFHVYSVKAFVSSASVTIQAGPGGSGQVAPAFLRVTRDPPLITNFVPIIATTEFDYAQIVTSTAAITASTEATAVAVITGNSVVYDGSTRVKLEFFCGDSQSSTGTDWYAFFRDNVALGQQRAISNHGWHKHECFDTPPAGAHTYSFRTWMVGGGQIVINAGNGTPGNTVPAFLRVVRA